MTSPHSGKARCTWHKCKLVIACVLPDKTNTIIVDFQNLNHNNISYFDIVPNTHK